MRKRGTVEQQANCRAGQDRRGQTQDKRQMPGRKPDAKGALRRGDQVAQPKPGGERIEFLTVMILLPFELSSRC